MLIEKYSNVIDKTITFLYNGYQGLFPGVL